MQAVQVTAAAVSAIASLRGGERHVLTLPARRAATADSLAAD
jgi:hypothetical protein